MTSKWTRSVLAVLLLSGAGLPVWADTAESGHTVLILAPQGVDPAVDTAGFNALVKNVTQAFAEAIQPTFTAHGRQPVNVLDQTPKVSMSDKLSHYAVTNGARSVLVLTVEPETVGKDHRIDLQAQYIQLEFQSEGGAVKAVKPTTVLKQSYVLRSTLTGDSKKSMTDLAKDFADYLHAQGQL